MATVVSDSNDAVILHDFDGAILAWNRGAKETYGYTEAEALRMNVRDIVAESDRDAALALIQEIKRGKIVKSFELRRVTKDNRILDVWLTTTLLTDERSQPVAIATTERDITERNKAEIALKGKLEELRRMATVVSDSNDAVIMHDFDGKILAWNRGAIETYGYTEAEALVMNVRDIVAESDRNAALLLIREIKQGTIVKSFELRRVTKDNRILDVWLTTTLLRNEMGRPVAIATTERDVTERNAAELARRDELEQLRRMATVVSDSNDAVIMHDFDGNILAWNRGANETYGFTEAEALRMNVRDIVAESDREAALTLIQKIRRGELVKSFELRRVTKDGRILDVWLTTTLLTDERGRPVAIATTERDITKRNKAEIAMKQKLEELRRMATVVSDSNDAVILYDFDGKILAWNRGAKETYGYTEAEALRMNVRDIVAESDREAALTLIEKIKNGEVVKSFELRRITKDNRILDVWLTTTLLTDENGLPVAIGTTERDITERKRAEAQISKLNEDLELRITERTKQLVEAQEELVRKGKLAVLGQVAGSVGHELRNPLGVMSNAVFFLQTMLPDADEITREYLGIIKDEITAAESIVSGLLDSVRTRSPQPEAVDLSSLIGRLLSKCTVPASIAIELDIAPSLPRVLVDAQQIQQVFNNLISNGLEAMPDGGTLEIRAKENPSDMSVTVRVGDTGVGMSREQQAKLFQPLFTTKARGIGLGLVVVKNLVQANRGSIDVGSEPGAGSTFAVTLPCKGEAA
ncbi:MAG: hypothetical protein NVS1B2_13930 [Vulcanimicrobiaceae bacterium]